MEVRMQEGDAHGVVSGALYSFVGPHRFFDIDEIRLGLCMSVDARGFISSADDRHRSAVSLRT